MGKYNVTFLPVARREIKKITERSVLKKISKQLIGLESGPNAIADVKKLARFKNKGLYRFRQGNYRVVFAVNKNSRDIQIVGVCLRTTIYKKIATRTS